MKTIKVLVAALAISLLTGCQRETSFPEDQRIEGPFHFGTEWQTIQPDQPLAINREGLQRLHLIVDEERFEPNFLQDSDDVPNSFNLRRKDGVMIRPEVVLVGNSGEEVPVTSTGNTWLYSGGLTVNFGTFKDMYSPAPAYPEDIETFQSIRIRSNEPLEVAYMQWWVDRHPDHHRCGNRRCSWWDNIFQ